MYRALRSFTGLVTMAKNEVKPIEDKVVAEDLLRAGYIVEEGKPASKKSDEATEEVKEEKPKKKSK